MEMNEEHFVHCHQGVVQEVISRDAFKRVMAFLKLSSFCRKRVKDIVPEEIADLPDPEPSSSHDTGTSAQEVQRKAKGKGRGKGQPRARKSAKTVHVEHPVVQVVNVLSNKSDMTTQTDSDFEQYLDMSEAEFQRYQLYKQQQLMQQYLVTTIQEEDFAEYDAACN